MGCGVGVRKGTGVSAARLASGDNNIIIIVFSQSPEDAMKRGVSYTSLH